MIMGHLIPAGTGFSKHRGLRLVPLGEPVEPVREEKIEMQPEEAVI